MKFDEFTNCYPVSKTLKFKLIPVGETQDTLNRNRIVENDAERASDYKRIKKIIDRYHVQFIEQSLNDVSINDFAEYISISLSKERTDADNEKLHIMEDSLRKQITTVFTMQPEFKKLFSKELILEILPQFVDNEGEFTLIKKFSKFTTAFVGFYENRKNVYTSEPIPTSVAYRCVNDNLPKYINNIFCYEKIRDVLGNNIRAINDELLKLGYELSVSMCLSKDNYCYVLSQKGIDIYNAIIGGWVTDDGRKVPGLNEYVNLYNQQLDKTEKSKRLPKFQSLYKQILSDSDRISFYQDGIESDEELLLLLQNAFCGSDSIYDVCMAMNKLIARIDEYDMTGIYIQNGAPLTSVSKGAFGEWNRIGLAWESQYKEEHPVGKMSLEKYEEKMRGVAKKIGSFSISDINDLLRKYDTEISSQSVQRFFKEAISDRLNLILNYKNSFDKALTQESKIFSKKDADTVALIKNMLDTIKDFERIVGFLKGNNTEPDKDTAFYGEFYLLYDQLREIDNVYNQVRNYITKKPFSTEKYKLYFDQGNFLSGWDAGGSGGDRSAFLLKDGKYYLMISATNSLPKISECDNEIEDCYEKIDYRLLTGANKMLPKVIFSNAHIGEFQPGEDLLRIRQTESFKKGPNFNIEDCHKLIEFYQNCISKHEWGAKFDFVFRQPNQYEDISKFYRDVEIQGYKLVRQKVNTKLIDDYVSEGKIYLFQIYNKDFSEYSHGKPNLHTLYFTSLFKEEFQNIIKLNGGAEMFMRRASIGKDDMVVHQARKPISSKNADNPKRNSCFEYDIIKDKRYTVDQFELHVPICLNWTASANIHINNRVRELLHANETHYVIGIDRGERNLLYVCVINDKGEIVEQYSLNDIINEYSGVSYKTDYHKLLEYKEKERKDARQNWTAVENIKELKEGYISQVVHKICQLVIKYNAVIALEDLNGGFKRSRTKVEKQVYQKFEKALIDKLNYLSDKDISFGENGSIVHGYQLAEKFDSFSRMKTQSGIVFYIPAWLTSKIDPTTGFVDLLHPKYENKDAARKFIMSFEKIEYIKGDDMFVFGVDYSNFQRTDADFKKKWQLFTNGERIRTFRNPAKNNEWDYAIINLTEAMKNLLEGYGFNFEDEHDLREELVNVNESKFYSEFIGIIKLMLQMRNSISGRTDVDYLISPVKNEYGSFYDSRAANSELPLDADANGAYNIARKVLWVIDKFKNAEISDLAKVKIAMTQKEWLEYAQTNTLT